MRQGVRSRLLFGRLSPSRRGRFGRKRAGGWGGRLRRLQGPFYAASGERRGADRRRHSEHQRIPSKRRDEIT